VVINSIVLRAKAEVMADRRDESCLEQAEVLFEQSIDLARSQGALTLELASAMGLSRLLVSSGRAEQARSLLKRVVEQFTEGRDLPPMREAYATMKALETLTGCPSHGSIKKKV
jgi:predicted ATPase